MKTAIPGDFLANADSHAVGPGTHLHDSKIYASRAGTVSILPSAVGSGQSTVSISRSQIKSTAQPVKFKTLPVLNSTVLCRITRVQQRQANASVLAVDPSPTLLLPDSLTQLPTTTSSSEDIFFGAVLRREDVRLTEKDKVVMNESFRVGDIIRGTVISIGDERSYYISTGGNELGVVIAKSELGNAMIPASWKEMRDVITGRVEMRKVAKPV